MSEPIKKIFIKPPALDWNDEGVIQEWAQQVWEHLKAEWDSSDPDDGSRD